MYYELAFVFEVSGKSLGLYQQSWHLVWIDCTWLSPVACSNSAKASPVGSESAIGCAKRGWPSEVRQRPVASSNCQPCMVQVIMPFSIWAKRVKSAFR